MDSHCTLHDTVSTVFQRPRVDTFRMTGDPNQQSRPNIFGEDYNYPAPNPEWNRFAGNNFYMQSNFPFCSNFGPAPVTFPLHSSNKNGNCFGPIYNYQANSTNVFTPPVNTSSYSHTNASQQSAMAQQDRIRFKRKTDSPCHIITKQHITEEKMAEHMSKLHISSETPVRNESEADLSKRLYMCEEMKKLQTDSILPESLLNRLQRPCTALVLWQPPPRLVPPVPQQNNYENDNNNEEEVPDQNLMDLV